MPAQLQARKRSAKKLWIGGLLVVAGIITITLIASSKSDPAAEGDTDLWIIQLERARDAVCDTCKDDQCVRKAMAELDDWHRKLGDHVKPTDEQAKHIHSLLGAMGKCVGGPSGDSAPPAGDDVATAIDGIATICATA